MHLYYLSEPRLGGVAFKRLVGQKTAEPEDKFQHSAHTNEVH